MADPSAGGVKQRERGSGVKQRERGVARAGARRDASRRSSERQRGELGPCATRWSRRTPGPSPLGASSPDVDRHPLDEVLVDAVVELPHQPSGNLSKDLRFRWCLPGRLRHDDPPPSRRVRLGRDARPGTLAQRGSRFRGGHHPVPDEPDPAASWRARAPSDHAQAWGPLQAPPLRGPLPARQPMRAGRIPGWHRTLHPARVMSRWALCLFWVMVGAVGGFGMAEPDRTHLPIRRPGVRGGRRTGRSTDRSRTGT